MNHNKSMRDRITQLHGRALRSIYSSYTNNFQELLDRDGSVTNIQALATLMHKVENNKHQS